MENTSVSPPASDASGLRLETWKQIAAYLKRDVRTVQRWEKTEGLPVHRHRHAKLATVYAHHTELDVWWSRRRPALEAEEASGGPRISRRFWIFAAAAAAALCTGFYLLRPGPAPLHPATRRVWTGPDTDRIGGVSPDGRFLAISNKESGDLAVVEIATGRERLLTRKPAKARTGGAMNAVFSPGASQIAYLWDEGGDLSIRVAGLKGEPDRVMYRDAGGRQAALAWSPSGDRLAAMIRQAHGATEILEFDAATGGRRPLATIRGSCRRFAYSPDGKYLAFDFVPADAANALSDVYVLPFDTKRPMPLITNAGNDFLLAWAGSGILFASDRTGSMDAWAVRFESGAARGEPELIFRDLGYVAPLGFSRDGNFYYGRRAAVTDVYSATMDFESGQLLSAPKPESDRYTGVNTSPDWSPDGASLAYVPLRLSPALWPSARLVIRTMSPVRERVVAVNLETLEMVRWCAGGKTLIGTGSNRDTTFHLVRIDAATGESVSVKTPGTKERVTFHEPFCVGSRILYKRRIGFAEPGALLSMDETGRETTLLPSMYRGALSSDGRRLLYSTFDDNREYIGILPLDGSPPTEVYSEPRSGRIMSVAWAPGERQVLFAKSGKLWRVAAGGRPEELPLRAESLRELRVHGSRIAFTAGSTAKGEVWVLENLAAAIGRGSTP